MEVALRSPSSMYPQPLGLNLDVWLQIMELAPRSAIAGLMGTCRTLNRVGTRYLFDFPLTVTSRFQLFSFMQFFLPPNNLETVRFRAQFPIGLSIHLMDLEETGGVLLSGALSWFFAIIVRAMPRFSHLELHHAEKLLSVSPGLGKAIASLTRVEILKVTRAGPLCEDMLTAMRSPLVFAHIHLDSEAEHGESERDCLLRNAHASLRVLETHRTGPVHRHGAVFPALKRLSQYACGFPFPEELMRVCPNLRCLHLDHSSDQRWDEVEEYHESHRHELFIDRKVRYWTSLYKYSGSLNVLYILALTCHISILDIRDERHIFPVPALRELLLDTTPSHLILRTSWSGASYYLDPEFVALMSQPGFWRWPMKSLELVIAFRPRDKELDLEKILENILHIVSATDIHAFRLHLDVHRIGKWLPTPAVFEWMEECDSEAEMYGDSASDDDDSSQEQELPPVERALKTLDLDDLVRRILSTRPSLKTAIVTLQGHSTRFFETRQGGPDIVYEEDTASQDSAKA